MRGARVRWHDSGTMPKRLIPPDRGNGWRPSSPNFAPSNQTVAGQGWDVAVLDVSEKTHELVAQRHAETLDDNHERQRFGAPVFDKDGEVVPQPRTVVQLDCQEPLDSSAPGPVTVWVGHSTLHEAATEVIGAYANLSRVMPEWVAGSDKELVAVVAEHFTVEGYNDCKVIKLEDVPA